VTVAVTDAARRNHNQLFGDRVSTLAQTDPELIAYFDNFAFDEVLTDSAALDTSLDARPAPWRSSASWQQSTTTPQTRRRRRNFRRSDRKAMPRLMASSAAAGSSPDSTSRARVC
jgi:hypothetical protein